MIIVSSSHGTQETVMIPDLGHPGGILRSLLEIVEIVKYSHQQESNSCSRSWSMVSNA